MHRPLAGNQGFSFMEVVIALAIFSIGIVALYGIQTMTVTQNFTSSRVTTVDTWAAGKIEELLTLRYDDVTDTDNDGDVGLADRTTAAADGFTTSPDGVYSLLWNVAETDDLTRPHKGYPLPHTKTIRVYVTTVRQGTGSLVEMEYIKHDSK